MTVRFTQSARVVDQITNGPRAQAAVAVTAQAIANSASEIAPHATGALAASYKATPGHPTATGGQATAYTADMAGHLAEWGSVNNPAYAPLRRAVARLGLRLRLTSRNG